MQFESALNKSARRIVIAELLGNTRSTSQRLQKHNVNVAQITK
jgi:hypothetical protein